METRLEELAEQYVSQGYVVVPQLVDEATRVQILHELPRFARGEYPVLNLPDGAAEMSPEDALSSVLAVHFPHWVSTCIRDAVAHPGIANVLAAIVGAHIPYWDGGVKCMQSMLFAKPPGLPGQAWHQDERYIPTRDRSLVGAWIALDDADEANGCLRVLPESHRPGKLYPLRNHGQPDMFDPGEESHGFDETGEVLVPVSAGDVIFFNGYLLHRSKRNDTSDRYRRALVNHYCSSSSPLPWLMAEGLDIGTADYRQIVPVVGDDVYPERGIEDPPAAVFLRPSTGSFTDAQEVLSD